MSSTSFKDLKTYHKLRGPNDVNRTNINSREDNYQDAVLANLEKKAKKKRKKNDKNRNQ